MKLLLATLLGFLFQLYLLPHTRVIEVSESLYYAPPTLAKHFTFGYDEITADSAWLRAIQDLDVCEQTKRNVSDAVHGKDRVAKCDKGWVYHMLDFVIELAPRFRMPQAVGPIMLSVVVDDREGATLLFEKAILNFPDDWPILFRAAYHQLYEEENFVRAAELFDLAGKKGAPFWVHALAARLYSRSGRNQIAKVVLEDFLKRTAEDSPGRAHIIRRLKEINALDAQNKGVDDDKHIDKEKDSK